MPSPRNLGGCAGALQSSVFSTLSAASRHFRRGRPAICANSAGPARSIPRRAAMPAVTPACIRRAAAKQGRPGDQMKEPVLATAANAVDHAVERRVLLVDWIVRIRQIFLRGHLVSTRLAVPHRRLRKHFLVRVHRRSRGWISQASRLRNRRRTVDKGQQGYRCDQLSHNGSPSWDPPTAIMVRGSSIAKLRRASHFVQMLERAGRKGVLSAPQWRIWPSRLYEGTAYHSRKMDWTLRPTRRHTAAWVSSFHPGDASTVVA